MRSMPRIVAILSFGLVACFLFGAPGLGAQSEQVFKGKICLGPEGRTPTLIDKEVSLPCVVPHPKRDANYILFNPQTKVSYRIEPRGKARAFAGRRVTVLGTLDEATGMVHLDEILDSLPPRIAEAKSVFIACDNCVRGMAAAWKAAFAVLEDWGRYDVIPDPKKADLVFLFSPNPYQGDYVTRDAPDIRGVKVETTYLNVVDPQTGANLWGDSRKWGSLFVAKATRSLIDQLRTQLALESQVESQVLPARQTERKTSDTPVN